jgi:hypothetical protein
MTTTTRGFEVGQQPVLSLDHVSARITTQTGPANQITVDVEGSQRYIDSLTIEQDGDVVSIREAEGAGGDGITVVSTGRGQGGVVVTGRGGIVAGNISGSVITGGGRVVVNGVDVTKLAREGGGSIENEPEPTITVTVPAGTNTLIERNTDVTLQHGGRVQGTVGGQGRLDARIVVSARLTISGQSTANVRLAEGTLTATVSDQSILRFTGRGTDVHLTVSGQSILRGDGVYESITGPVSGQSDVRITGQIGTDSLTTTGQSNATVNGRPSGYRPAPRRTGAWDF